MSELDDLIKPIRDEIATDLTNLVIGALTMPLVSKIQILEKRLQLKTKIVEVAEWGGEVILMELTGKQRDDFEASIVQMGTNGARNLNLRNMRARLVSKCLVEPDDFDIVEEASITDVALILRRTAVLKQGRIPRRMFNDVEANDLGDLGAISLDMLLNEAQQLSGLTEKDVSELVVNLKNDQTADFGSN